MNARVTQKSFGITSLVKTTLGAVLNASLLMMEKVTDTQKLANLLNNQFASIFTTEPDGEPPPAPKYIILSPMSTVVITVPMVQKRLKNLNANKSAGPDRIHLRLLKETATEISPALCHLFQITLGCRVVPSQWKTAYVTPIFKKGDRSKAENYRPTSLTSAVVKVVERIVNDTLLKHQVSNSIISNKQHSFLPGKSVKTNLLETYELITQLLDRGFPVDQILLDIAKAFNKVPHSHLHSKLTAVGTHKKLVNWLMDFLGGRTQKVWLCTMDGE